MRGYHHMMRKPVKAADLVRAPTKRKQALEPLKAFVLKALKRMATEPKRWFFPMDLGLNGNHFRALMKRGYVHSQGTQEMDLRLGYQYRITPAGVNAWLEHLRTREVT